MQCECKINIIFHQSEGIHVIYLNKNNNKNRSPVAPTDKSILSILMVALNAIKVISIRACLLVCLLA